MYNPETKFQRPQPIRESSGFRPPKYRQETQPECLISFHACGRPVPAMPVRIRTVLRHGAWVGNQQLLHRSIADVYCKVQVLLRCDLWKVHPRCRGCIGTWGWR